MSRHNILERTPTMETAIFERALTPEGWRDDVRVSWQDGRVVSVTPDAPAGDAPRVAGVMVPGVGNLHSHAFQRGFAGLAERRGSGAEDHFWTWREAMYRFAHAMTPEHLAVLAAMAQVEMLESGFTAVAEFHYLHHAADGRPYDEPAEMAFAVAEAAAETGIGLTLLPVFYAHGGFDDRPTGPGQRRFTSDLDLYARLHEGAARAVAPLAGATVGIAPHSLRAVNGRELSALLAAHPAGPVHIHVAEQTGEVDDCLAATGRRPVELLFDLAEVDARWCLVHATHVTEAEILRIAASGAVAGLCPITEADLGDGVFPAVDFRMRGGCYGVGSDSNVLISLPQELRLLEQSRRLVDRARNRLAEPPRSTGRSLFDAVLAGGGQALGRAASGLVVGAAADFVVLDTDHPALFGRGDDAVLDAWIFAAAANPVTAVWASGRQVVKDGHHVARGRVEAAYRRTVTALADAAR
jgi:formiminoglutamate deiminase